MSSLTSELLYIHVCQCVFSPSPFGQWKSKKLMYTQHLGIAHTQYEVAQTSVTNIQIIPFVGLKTIKTVDEV